MLTFDKLGGNRKGFFVEISWDLVPASHKEATGSPRTLRPSQLQLCWECQNHRPSPRCRSLG